VENGQLLILGMGCTLFSDQGFGVHVIDELDRRFEFPDDVRLVDGGTVGVHLLGTIAQAARVVAVDIVRKGGAVGTIYRIEGPEIIERLHSADHILQEAFIEALIHCRMLDDPPEAVLLGIEPDDAEALECRLTPALTAKTDEMIGMVLAEFDRLGIAYHERAG
jgi:hydrogenase maturation protease